MLLKSKHFYSILIMLDVAIHQSNGPVSISDIQQRQNISLSYLEQIFAKLKKRGMVRSIRGPGGGYRLKAETNQITILEIIQAVNNAQSFPRAHQETCNPHQHDVIVLKNLWNDLNTLTDEFLGQLTLEILINKYYLSKVALEKLTTNQ